MFGQSFLPVHGANGLRCGAWRRGSMAVWRTWMAGTKPAMTENPISY
ncbi:hypothetical protein SAMN05444169_3448 [Bradyrhizobium erythrophlei]|uniref:Uncharacterized protein n=1 Tax=Bradyrhizobium erythrophlei TaxID=1437360 RepID=A0A1M5LGF5_9BRAD|nr:hypothetical protein SAMN05444169_3448 [Bradyrhizobium erythrophlei]